MSASPDFIPCVVIYCTACSFLSTSFILDKTFAITLSTFFSMLRVSIDDPLFVLTSVSVLASTVSSLFAFVSVPSVSVFLSTLDSVDTVSLVCDSVFVSLGVSSTFVSVVVSFEASIVSFSVVKFSVSNLSSLLNSSPNSSLILSVIVSKNSSLPKPSSTKAVSKVSVNPFVSIKFSKDFTAKSSTFISSISPKSFSIINEVSIT